MYTFCVFNKILNTVRFIFTYYCDSEFCLSLRICRIRYKWASPDMDPVPDTFHFIKDPKKYPKNVRMLCVQQHIFFQWPLKWVGSMRILNSLASWIRIHNYGYEWEDLEPYEKHHSWFMEPEHWCQGVIVYTGNTCLPRLIPKAGNDDLLE
jgi:hypothetical protein